MINKFWNLEVKQDGKIADLYIYGLITDEKTTKSDVTAYEFQRELNKLGAVDELNVHIFSEGGSVFVGNLIYSMLKKFNARINVYIEGIAASIASVIAMAGDNIYIDSNAMLMIHNPLIPQDGLYNQIDLANSISDLEKVRDVMITAYTDKTHMTRDAILDYLDANKGQGTYFTADEAVRLGFADAITPSANEIPRSLVAMVKPNIYAVCGREVNLNGLNLPANFNLLGGIKNMGLETNEDTKTVDEQPKFKVTSKAKIEAPMAEIEPVSITCPECGAVFALEVDSEIQTLDTICPECGAELVIEPNASTNDAEVETLPPDETPVEVAYREGVMAERERVKALDERAQAMPQFADAIARFKAQGVSVKSATDWIFKAMASSKTKTTSYKAMVRNDAKILDGISKPAGFKADNVKVFKFNSLSSLRGAK
jgi:ATP-dependent Clp protease protease subunit